jgi:hypothetical protein
VDVKQAAFPGNRRTITITYHPDEDPDGWIQGLITRDYLGDFLAAYALAGDGLTGCGSDDAARWRLRALAYVTHQADGRLGGALLQARDQYRMGWTSIAAAVDLPRQTVKDRIVRTRQRHAAKGYWFAADGLHHDTPDAAHAALLAQANDSDD